MTTPGTAIPMPTSRASAPAVLSIIRIMSTSVSTRTSGSRLAGVVVDIRSSGWPPRPTRATSIVSTPSSAASTNTESAAGLTSMLGRPAPTRWMVPASGVDWVTASRSSSSRTRSAMVERFSPIRSVS